MSAVTGAVMQVLPSAPGFCGHDDDESVTSVRSPTSPHSPTDNTSLEVHQWTVCHVYNFLLSRGLKKLAVSASAVKIDGPTLLELNAAGWAELGLTSPIEQARIIGAVKVAASRGDSPRRPQPDKIEQLDVPEHAGVWSLVRSVFPIRSKLAGAEASLAWIPAVVNASSQGGVVKEHCLRFLGMYNVADLLILTIGIQYLMQSSVPKTPSELTMAFLTGVASALSIVGLFASTVLYNLSSAVSRNNFHAFAKSRVFAREAQIVEKCSIVGYFLTSFSVVALCCRLGTENNQLTTSFDVCRYIFVGIIPTVVYFLAFGPALFYTYGNSFSALYAGLLAEEEWVPPGRKSGWAIRASDRDVEKLVCARAQQRLVSFKNFEENIVHTYANDTSDAMERGAIDIESGEIGEVGTLMATLLRRAGSSSSQSGPLLSKCK